MLYLAHRWIGVGLGALVGVWFLSGFALVFYPWPSLTESARLALLPPLEADDSLIGFPRAHRAATAALSEDLQSGGSPPELTGGRLLRLDGHPVYRFWSDRDGVRVPAAVVDGQSGKALWPIDTAAAVSAARALVRDAPVLRVERLARGDRYTMNRDYAHEFPAWRVRFADPSATAVYVNERDGAPIAVATRLTRVTTWLGTVPHWLYFAWLYDRRDLWMAVSIALASAAVLLAITGIVLGLTQLLPKRRRGPRRLSPYQGVSRWHHLAGLTFGLLVLTWTFSGVLQMLGGSNLPRPGQAQHARSGAVRWSEIGISEAEAVRRIGELRRTGDVPVAIDVVQLDGRPGYRIRFRDRQDAWVDAVSGEPRGELTAEQARRVAIRIVPGAEVERVDRIATYDAYYYARAGRELHLPAWRVAMRDAAGSVIYLDTVDGSPTGFVDASSRRTRWLRDALHSHDYPLLNARPTLWRATLLCLLAAGALSAGSGVVLAIRRVRRTTRRGRAPNIAAAREAS